MSNVSIVIISKDQADDLLKMVEALRTQLPDIERCFVLDRCTDNSKQVLIDLNENFVENTVGIGFCAATARNVGLRNINPNNSVFFIDCERSPINMSIELIEQALTKYDITLLKCEQEYCRHWFTNDFAPNPYINILDNDVWSGAFVIRRSAIEKIKYINNGNLFNEFFNGRWGCEDLNLGDMAAALDLTCGGFPLSARMSGVVEASHDPNPVETRKQHSMRKLLRMALFIKFNKPINNDRSVINA